MDEFSIEHLDDRQLVGIIYQTFGVAVDYGTLRKDILKTLRRLSS